MQSRKISLLEGVLSERVFSDCEVLSLWEAEDPSETKIDGVGMENIGDREPEYWLVLINAEEDMGMLATGNHMSLSPRAALRLYDYIGRHREVFEQSVQQQEERGGPGIEASDPERLRSRAHRLNALHYCTQWFPELRES